MLGSASEAERVGKVAAPVVGAGLKLALPLFWTPPCTSITDAVTWALPLAERALDELESTKTPPGMLMLALPERVEAPPAVGSRTMIDWLIVIVPVLALLVRKLLSPE